jgi:hypothetical protein
MAAGWWWAYGVCAGLVLGQVGLWTWLVLDWMRVDLRVLGLFFVVWWLTGG